IRAGIGLLPENRKAAGLAMSLGVDINVNLASYDLISRAGFVNLHQEASRARRFVSDLTIRTPSIKQKVRNLSGGNQQKVVVAKWLSRESDIFIFDEPTVGVDVGAKVEIYKLIEALLAKGNAIILVSSYLPEVMGLAGEANSKRKKSCAWPRALWTAAMEGNREHSQNDRGSIEFLGPPAFQGREVFPHGLCGRNPYPHPACLFRHSLLHVSELSDAQQPLEPRATGRNHRRGGHRDDHCHHLSRHR